MRGKDVSLFTRPAALQAARLEDSPLLRPSKSTQVDLEPRPAALQAARLEDSPLLRPSKSTQVDLEPRPQACTNCIWVPASSIRSPLRNGAVSPTRATPLTLGLEAPSTWAMT